MKALENTEIAYLTVGIEYKTKVWNEQWPLKMQNVINACKVHHSKLVFFDNVYCYGKVSGWMTETSPIIPISRKGEIRTGIVKMLMEEVDKGGAQGFDRQIRGFLWTQCPTQFF